MLSQLVLFRAPSTPGQVDANLKVTDIVPVCQRLSPERERVTMILHILSSTLRRPPSDPL